MGFKSYKSFGSQNIQNAGSKISALEVVTPVKKTIVIACGNGTNQFATSSDMGVSWVVPSTKVFSAYGYRGAFDGSRVIIGGNNNLSYSDDFGTTWTNTGFTPLGSVYKVIYISATKTWFAVGQNGTNYDYRTMARSTDGINWTLLSNTLFNNGICYNVVYNGSTYIAVGKSTTYPMAVSSDGINWSSNTTYQGTTNGICLLYDGSKYLFGGSGNAYATSQDGITWTSNTPIPLYTVFCIAYNGKDTYVACGTRTTNSNFYWSNDSITWYPANNNLLGNNVYWVDWNGTNFVACGQIFAGSTILYSPDGKTWTASTNSPFTTNGYGITSITY